MTVLKALSVSVAAAAIAMFAATAVKADVAGKYKRPNGKLATVTKCGGGIRAVASNGTVMFRCAKKRGSTWKSNNMKHPEFPGTFKGTIRKTGSGLNVQGCFGFICPSENWKKL